MCVILIIIHKKAIMSSSITTREFGYFLVKFEVDDRYYVCTRIKILTEGRVRIGGYYNVVCGRTDDEADIAEVVYTGDWLDMQKKMTEFEVQLNSPVSSPSPSPPELPSQLKRGRPAAKIETTKKQKPEANILCIEEGIIQCPHYRHSYQHIFLPRHRNK